jgi:drug/metabolite transporter (DMT)-like permease
MDRSSISAAAPAARGGVAAAREGLIFGLLGVSCFSLTLPATRIAVADLDPTIVGLGRAIIAAALALAVLLARRQPLPPPALWPRLGVVALGVVVGFPWLSAWAMDRVPAIHGAVLTGLLPLSTAAFAALLAGERPSPLFWLATAAGSAVVVGFALLSGGGGLELADLALLAAVAAAGLGYAEGARLARRLGAWAVICWALLLSAPVLIVPVGLEIAAHGVAAHAASWLGFAYVSVVSMFLGFFAWYRGLAKGGIARVGQLQLLQPFLTILAAALLLGEAVTPLALGAAALVLLCVAAGRRARIGGLAPGTDASAGPLPQR